MRQVRAWATRRKKSNSKVLLKTQTNTVLQLKMRLQVSVARKRNNQPLIIKLRIVLVKILILVSHCLSLHLGLVLALIRRRTTALNLQYEVKLIPYKRRALITVSRHQVKAVAIRKTSSIPGQPPRSPPRPRASAPSPTMCPLRTMRTWWMNPTLTTSMASRSRDQIRHQTRGHMR
jgi:hypothetical protein